MEIFVSREFQLCSLKPGLMCTPSELHVLYLENSVKNGKYKNLQGYMDLPVVGGLLWIPMRAKNADIK